jgi:hypothetical protein
VFDWSGNNPLPPEIWLLPYILPIHPGNPEKKILGICSLLVFSRKKDAYSFECKIYRKDVVSLSDGLFANVLHIRKEVCW